MVTGTESSAPTETAWLTLGQAADLAKVSTATLRREIRKGRLRHARVAGRRVIRIRSSWIDEWLEQSTAPIEG